MQFRVCACSQFNGTLEWLKTRLTEEGFGFRTSASPALHPQPIWGTADPRLHAVNGSMPLKQRAKAIDAFQNDPPTTVRAATLCLPAACVFLCARASPRRCFCCQVRYACIFCQLTRSLSRASLPQCVPARLASR